MESIKHNQNRPARNYYKYYRVNENDTNIIEITANDFKLNKVKPLGVLRLGVDFYDFSLFTDIGKAMEKAKAGARAYIEQLIREGGEGSAELLQYRIDHYEDLNFNLVDKNIQKEENEMQTQANFKYRPYRIGPGVDGNSQQ